MEPGTICVDPASNDPASNDPASNDQASNDPASNVSTAKVRLIIDGTHSASDLFSLTLRDITSGTKALDFQVATTLPDSNSQLALTAETYLASCDSDLTPHGVYCELESTWEFWFILFLIILATSVGVLIIGRKYYIYRRDWKVHRTTHFDTCSLKLALHAPNHVM